MASSTDVYEITQKTIFSWSGGKDSALALFMLIRSKDITPITLLTTLTEEYGRVSMHGVRQSLLDEQARSLGFSVEKVFIKAGESSDEYENKMRYALQKYRAMGISMVAFGDIFLEELKKYRQGKLSSLGMKALFPLWKKDTKKLAMEFIDLGFKAVVTCVDSKVLDKEFAGRDFDKKFVSELPENVDPCAENGEFHSFVYDGPIFKKPVPYTKGKVILRDNRFYFCDLLPV